MSSFRADLHCHSSCSDGSVSPTDLLLLAKQQQLSGLSITDHDTIEAYVTAIPKAKELQLPLISGVEFSAEFEGHSIHVLAYSFALQHPVIRSLCEQHHARREQRYKSILKALLKHGINITEEEVIRCAAAMPNTHYTIGRPHIAQAMLKKGYVDTIQDAFNRYIGEGTPCYVPTQAISVEETISLIQQANGFAILAHPHLIKEPNLISKLLQLPFDGLEGYYCRFTAVQNERWIKVAQKKGWLLTGGSDFHGTIKPNTTLGSSWVSEETFTILQNRFIGNTT